MPSEPNYQQALESLAKIVGRSRRFFFANDDPSTFLQDDLDLNRLNRIHDYLWLAGRPMAARPLHRYRLIGYDILGTQQMDLHLIKHQGSPNKLWVKPLPYWIFSHEFWSKHICHEDQLWQSAAGLLASYTWLITTPLDLQVALDLTLLPGTVTWAQWKLFVRSFCEHVDVNRLHQVSRSCSIYGIKMLISGAIR